MFKWFNSNRQKTRQDRTYLEGRARRLLQSYLASNDEEKQRYYQAIAGAAAACQPGVSDPSLDNERLAGSTAEAAMKVVRRRTLRAIDEHDHLALLITDAYATVAVAYRRAAAVYTADKEMERLGTAAVHLVTIANSLMNAESQQRETER
ncbi:hypothetical protein [Bradyrhizobium sp.]|uniref:hypothetical protein n=1 Tax=Bradyrhizobium sp. TaxID=376 RepID=UPI0007C97407|nr:hypothetical protein [Bradyrhizobium sp.]